MVAKLPARVGFYSTKPIQSYNAILNFTNAPRNKGKTWAHKERAAMKYKKSGKKTVWVRRFQKEAKLSRAGFLNKKICKHMGIDFADIRQNGSKIMMNCPYKSYRLGGKMIDKWDWFTEILPLSECRSHKSVDDPDTETLVFDEYTTANHQYNMYKGNEVEDVLNLIYTKKRDNDKFNAFFTGNKENITNPYFNYLGIKPPPEFWEGIKTYKHGSIAIEQYNEVPSDILSDWDRKMKYALEGTPMLDFIYGGAIASIDRSRIVSLPKGSSVYICCDLGIPFTIYINGSCMYTRAGVDASRTIGVVKPTNKYNKIYVISSSDKNKFSSLRDVYKFNGLYHCDIESLEQSAKLLDILNIR